MNSVFLSFYKIFLLMMNCYAIIQKTFLGEVCSGLFCLFHKFLAVTFFHSSTVSAYVLSPSDEKAHWKLIFWFLLILFQMSLLLWVVLFLFTRAISVLHWVLSLVFGNFFFPRFRFWICKMLFSHLGCFVKANKIF